MPIRPLPVPKPRAPKSKRRHVPNLVNWLVGLVVLGVLGVLALPAINGGCGSPSAQVRAMAQAKQIGLALKLFASDHDGEYPRDGLPGLPAARIGNANEAYAMLFPAYLTAETIFGNQRSPYQTRQPDNVIDSPYAGRPVRTLEPGENVYAYVSGLNDAGNPSAPLVADGTDGTGHYTTDPKKPGGVWEGRRAVVVHVDNSAALETLAGPDHARYVPRRQGENRDAGGNVLDVSDLGPGMRLLDPAVDRRVQP